MIYIVFIFLSIFLVVAGEYFLGEGILVDKLKVLFGNNSLIRILRPKNVALVLEIIAGGIMGSSIFERVFKDGGDNIYLASAIFCGIVLIELAARIKEGR